jgi:cytochrome c-type biogenesis protein CcmH
VSRTAHAALALLAAIALTSLVATPVARATPKPRASLTDIENDVMCTICHEPLAVAQSLEADQERTYIRGLIAQGLTKQQILNNLVVQYGVNVLGRPPAHGFNLTIYVLPPAILAVGIGILAVVLPRWRRRTRAAAAESDDGLPPLDPVEQERLEQDLSQFRG